jgi:uncharacterized Ntn-hydrolase superfamily protein
MFAKTTAPREITESFWSALRGVRRGQPRRSGRRRPGRPPRLEEFESRLLLTRSIVAADPVTGQVGIAVVSFPTGVPAVVPVGEPGIIVADQATPSYAAARAIIAGIEHGEDAATAIAQAIRGDVLAQQHQFGVAALSDQSPTGVTVATFTGTATTSAKCGLTGPTFAVQANLQTSADVCAAMANGFTQETGSLGRRLLSALLAGRAVGSDQRGEFSASVRVFSGQWDLASSSPVSAEANVGRSAEWATDLTFSLNAYLATLTRGDPADRVPLTPERIEALEGALQQLGYYQGQVRDRWTDRAERALADFSRANLHFVRHTVVRDGVRFIDAPLVDYLVEGLARGVLRPAADGSPEGGVGFFARSIVAADPVTRQVGIAVVSFPTGVPAVVPVGEPGVIVANPAIPSYATARAVVAGVGQGEDAATALDQALAGDPDAAVRQFGVAALSTDSATGVTVATFTGDGVPDDSCNLAGDTFAVQASGQTSADVCGAMAKAFTQTVGSLSRRLLAALEAGGAAGTDRRGEFSASVRVYAARWEFATYTPVNVDANVDRSANWADDLAFGVNAYLSFWTSGTAADLVELTPERAEAIEGVLHDLGYYQGEVTGDWTTQAEQALVSFSSRNLAFSRRTTVSQGVRFIDAPLAEYLIAGAARGVLRPATDGGSPARRDDPFSGAGHRDRSGLAPELFRPEAARPSGPASPEPVAEFPLDSDARLAAVRGQPGGAEQVPAAGAKDEPVRLFLSEKRPALRLPDEVGVELD